MTFLGSLKNLLTTGSRAPVEEGVPGEGLRDLDLDASAMTTAQVAENIGGFGDSAAPTNWVPSQQDVRPRH